MCIASDPFLRLQYTGFFLPGQEGYACGGHGLKSGEMCPAERKRRIFSTKRGKSPSKTGGERHNSQFIYLDEINPSTCCPATGRWTCSPVLCNTCATNLAYYGCSQHCCDIWERCLYFFRGALLATFSVIVSIDSEGHRWSGVPQQILYLLDV